MKASLELLKDLSGARAARALIYETVGLTGKPHLPARSRLTGIKTYNTLCLRAMYEQKGETRYESATDRIPTHEFSYNEEHEDRLAAGVTH